MTEYDGVERSRTDLSATERLRALLDERDVKYQQTTVTGGTLFTVSTDDECYFILVRDNAAGIEMWSQYLTPEQAIAATVGAESWEPSKEWKVWHESLKHDNPTSIREVVENILYEAIGFGGDMGPNGNVWSGVDEGDVLTDGCINGWVKIIEEISATVGEECEMRICKRCGVAYELNIIDKGFGKPRFCPNCGYREMYQ